MIKSRAMTSPDPHFSRKLAAEAIARLLRKQTPLDASLAAAAKPGVAWQEIAFARRLAETALRRLGSIDWVIDHCLKHKLPPKTEAVRDFLRIGLAQIFFMETADHAAVHTTVELIANSRRREAQGLKNLANALLRRCVREREAFLNQVNKQANLDTPPWLWQRWTAAYGETAAGRIAAAHRLEPPLDLVFHTKAGRDNFVKQAGGSPLPTGALRLDRQGKVSTLPGFSEGRFWVQDMAAGLAVPLFGSVADKKVADLCAAPGGKTLQLAAGGGHVTAVDISTAKCALLRENLQRTGLSADIVTSNIMKWRPRELFDCVLLDAPCSATGTIRRHPDLPYLKRPSDIEKLRDIQAGMLTRAFSFLQPGGTLIYCVCSLEPEEGEQQVAAFLDGGPGAKRQPVEASEAGGLKEAITADGDVRTLPCHLEEAGGMDGFFISRLMKAG